MEQKKPIRMIDGFSESLWTSLAVKSLRIGWLPGLRECEKRLSDDRMTSTMICGMFEDIFPPISQWEDTYREIREHRYEELCLRNTHHGRGLTPAFFNLKDEAVRVAREQQGEVYHLIKTYPGLWAPPRSLNCFYTWHKLQPKAEGELLRSVDQEPFTGIPEWAADMHTIEGKRDGRRVTILSGTYEQHLEIGKMVMEIGWDEFRKRCHAYPVYKPEVQRPKLSAFF